MSEQLFIRTRGRIQGPLSLDQIQNLVRRGQFGRLHEVSEDGIQWVRASNYPHLFVKTAQADSGGTTTVERTSGSAVDQKVVEEASYAVSDGARPTAPGKRSAAGSDKSWYYATDSDEQVGPITQADLFDLVRIGRVTEATRVWSDGLADWQPLREVAELASVLLSSRTPTVGNLRSSADSGRIPQLSQSGFRSLIMTRPWVVFLSILMWLLVAAYIVGAIILFIQAGKQESSSLLIEAIVASISTCLVAVQAALMLRYANRINTLVIERTTESLERALHAQLYIWRFWGISCVAVTLAGLLLIAFLMIFGAVAA